MNDVKAAVLYAKDDIRVEEMSVPSLEPHEILVKVKATGICGSDLPRVLGDAAHHYPLVLGHEFSGVVEKIGIGVSRVKVGDRVAGVPLKPCFKCHDCASGNFAQCKYYSFIGSRVNGSWAEYVAIPEINALPFDESISFEEAAFVEPSAVALHALQLIQFQGGEHVAILGGGNIGLLTLQWVKILGAREVTVFDIDDERLETARALGADHTINAKNANVDEDWKTITKGKGFAVVLETAGSDVTMRQSFDISANKAKVCFVGTPVRDLTFTPKQFEQLNRKEFTLTGSWMSYSAPFPGNEWELTLHFLKLGRLNFKALIDRTFPLDNINEAFDLYRKPGSVKGKIMMLND
ncbi:galactitol-1-phosphate 5-dehydrogenase [Paenibacillus alkaliterrae]|uniref:galactitol-1-phosphate 5-dehydrogenase n=1 Tax=Paenibacillus alkaliterrae TaxID=320909 RepID=UPI001F2191B5|nr:galactitol-1-phosphate 5-dehydrogenase [Paenibacillus alkaliterrae]MCF2941342.1 galactitol-1-phosphate 5-dehydrogenase [Paenibacillus alkaliterrae]